MDEGNIDGRWRGVVDDDGDDPSQILLELCPRGNNKYVIIIILVHDKVYIPC